MKVECTTSTRTVATILMKKKALTIMRKFDRKGKNPSEWWNLREKHFKLECTMSNQSKYCNVVENNHNVES